MAERVTVAKTTDIPLNEARAFPVGDRMIAIFNQDGQFHAMDDFCPHMGASLACGTRGDFPWPMDVGWITPRSKSISLQ
jgi:nitrite reductase (NADH) small subunit/3-phenylpropionate/trans-cinnamate dioxygenase ferredoxin subunit